ncbi:hypothetical protein ABEB36_005829 [Hypothenemus hampei]|uniref:Odorant receptor n=1 Tax=Hypothenemus hampei TaxID=57062 RepID=A0ABD1EZL8_HYPHA
MVLFDFLKYSQFALETTAVWPQNKSSWMFLFRTILTLGVIGIFAGCQVYNSALLISSFVKFSQSLYLLNSYLNVCIKIIILQLKRKAFLKLIHRIENQYFIKYEQVYEHLIANVDKTINTIQWIYWSSAIFCCIFTSIFPVVDPSKSLPMEYPHFNNGPFHIPFYICEMISLFMCAICNTAMDMLFVGLSTVALVQLIILNNKLKDTSKIVKCSKFYSDENRHKLTVEYIKECCEHYIEIEGFLENIENIFSVILFIQLGISVFAICNGGLMLINVEILSLQGLSVIFYIMAMVMELGVYCWFGNNVYFESLEIIHSCSLSNWYEESHDVKKMLLILMERTKRPLEIKALNFTTINANTFVAILKWSYSYFALLNNFTN